MKRAQFVLAIAAMIGSAAMMRADEKPTFAGDWKLDVDKSDFGPAPIPDTYTRHIEQKDTAIRVKQTQTGAQGEQTTDIHFTTDGKEVVNDVQGNEAKIVAVWEGKNLVITTNIDIQGNKIVLKQVWALSDDGKAMSDVIHITGPQGEFDIKVALKKV